MNNKGQTMSIGAIVSVIMGIIVCSILIIAIAQGTDKVVNSRTTTNGTYAAPATNGYFVLTGQDLLSTPVIFNASGIAGYPDSGNQTANSSVFTCDSNVSATGTAQIYCKNNGYPTWGAGNTQLYVTYTWGEDGYAKDSAARTMLTLVILLSAVALLVWVANETGLLDWTK